MGRNILVAACGIVLCFLLMAPGAWVLLALFPLPTEHSHSDWLGVLDRGAAFLRYVIAPAIALVVGVFVGWFAHRPAWAPAVLATLPASVVLTGGLADALGILCGLVYAFLGGTAAWAVSKRTDR